ncbi:MOSC domain-containing protein [Draconibacterium sp.]
MKIISTNIGEPKTINWNGKEVTTGIFKYPVTQPIFLGSEDVENDHVIDRRYHGGVDKACYLYSADHYKYWQTLYPDLELPWGIFGENLTVEGLHEADVNIGDVFRIGEAVVQATQPRQPCFKLEFRFNDNQIVRKFIDSGFAGVYVRVIEKGHVKLGDSMELIERKKSLTIHKIYELIYTDKVQKEAVEQAVNDPFIAASCRRDLLKRWGSEMNV